MQFSEFSLSFHFLLKFEPIPLARGHLLFFLVLATFTNVDITNYVNGDFS